MQIKTSARRILCSAPAHRCSGTRGLSPYMTKMLARYFLLLVPVLTNQIGPTRSELLR